MNDRNLTYTKTITMVTEICCNCGIVFGIPSDFQDDLIKTHKTFYCPNGHSQSYGENAKERELKKAQQEKAEVEKRLHEMTDRMLDETSKRVKAEKQLKRVHKGVCPCCNRTFQNLQKHMETKHPEVAKKLVVAPIHDKINAKKSPRP